MGSEMCIRDSFGAVSLPPEKLKEELNWIDEHVDGMPYGIDLIVPNKYEGKGEDFSTDQILSAVPQGHRDFAKEILTDYNIDTEGLDNISEHIKGIGEIPEDGRYIIRDNFFGTNKGHNDVIDVDSGWRPNPILQIIGNYFSGSGDELCDLGGDVFLSENIFLNVFKDDETSDRGYANAISTGDVGPDATFSISRNVFARIVC